MAVIVPGMYYEKFDCPQPCRYWELVVYIPEGRSKHGQRSARAWTVSIDMGRAVVIDEVMIEPPLGRIRLFERGVMVEPLWARVDVSYERRESKEKEGMSTQQPPLSLHRLTFVSALNQDLVADYLAHLRTRHYGLNTLQTTLGALVTFYRSLPPLGSRASGQM